MIIGCVVNKSFPSTNESVKECRFADVRSSENDYGGETRYFNFGKIQQLGWWIIDTVVGTKSPISETAGVAGTPEKE
jgi:hypothetical protein